LPTAILSLHFFWAAQNCQTSDIGRNCDLADEAGGSGSTSGDGPNCRPQGLDDRPRGLPNLEKTRKDTLNKNARQSHNQRPSSEGRFSFGWPLFAQRPSDQGNICTPWSGRHVTQLNGNLMGSEGLEPPTSCLQGRMTHCAVPKRYLPSTRSEAIVSFGGLGHSRLAGYEDLDHPANPQSRKSSFQKQSKVSGT
jgi:hypothetical protein